MHEHEVTLKDAMAESEESKQEFEQYKREMMGDWELKKHKEGWDLAVDSFMDLAHTNGKGYDNPTALCELICDKLSEGEPALKPASHLTLRP